VATPLGVSYLDWLDQFNEIQNMKNKHAVNLSKKQRQKLNDSLNALCSETERQMMIERDAKLSKVGLDDRKELARKKCEERRKKREYINSLSNTVIDNTFEDKNP
jgi:hypothetical protein